jgi:hypothetical protein
VVRRDGSLVDYIDGRLLASHRGLRGGSPHWELAWALLLLPIEGNMRRLRRIPLRLSPAAARHVVAGHVFHLEDGVLRLRAPPAPGPPVQEARVDVHALEGEAAQAAEDDEPDAVVADGDAMVDALEGEAAQAAEDDEPDAVVADGDAMVGALEGEAEEGAHVAEVADVPVEGGAAAEVAARARDDLLSVYDLMDAEWVTVERLGRRRLAVQAAARLDHDSARAKREAAKLRRGQLVAVERYDRLFAQATDLRLVLSNAHAHPISPPARLRTHPSQFL